jgi:hypothetical protein
MTPAPVPLPLWCMLGRARPADAVGTDSAEEETKKTLLFFFLLRSPYLAARFRAQ